MEPSRDTRSASGLHSRTVRTGIAAIVIGLALTFGAAGCARVKPYQRENLARRSMERDRGRGETRFEQHARGSREGSDGGSGEAGGGCGCN